MSSPYKVHELLSRAELDELESFAREPGRTGGETHDWLTERSFNVSLRAAERWLAEFKAELLKQRFSGSAELAAVIKKAVEGGQFEDVAQGAVMQLTQVIFEQAAALQADGEIDPEDVLKMSASLKNLVGSKAGLTKILAERFDREMKARQAARSDGMISAQDIEEARKRIFG